ncbi:Txe/YoeB family addiction module toxin [Pedobacter sp. N23S346]|uniref:Txe/YoeB family addiction module toxin n=1 Tax=Pedobacter sp. N23S346 TaxID=3402750 RepID=UPI003AC9F723
MSFHLEFSNQAKNDIDYHKKAGNNVILKKLLNLLNELSEHPFEGAGKPEALKHNLSGFWSRRINNEYRLVYEVSSDIVYIISVKGHY